MKAVNEPEKYFVISDFEEGWGMEDVVCEEQLYDYCIEALFVPEDNIDELSMHDNCSLEISLKNLEIEDIAEDWYVNLKKLSTERF